MDVNFITVCIGNPVEGPCAEEKQALKQYVVDTNGNKIYIHN